MHSKIGGKGGREGKGGLQHPPPHCPPNLPAAKFTSQGDAHVRTNAQIKFLYYPLTWAFNRSGYLSSSTFYIQGFWQGLSVSFTNLSLMEFQVKYLAFFCLFSVIDGLKWFWIETLYKNIQLLREFLEAPFLVLHFSYYKLMILLMPLTLLSMLIALLSTLSVKRHLICGDN